jgi:sialic acid synthase SpsE
MSQQMIHDANIIAEIGVNWYGDIDIAKQMIHEASIAGVDAVKFQTFNEENIKHYPQKIKDELTSMILDEEKVRELIKYTHSNSLLFGTSVMYKEAFDWLGEIDILKIRYNDRKNRTIKNCVEEYLMKNKTLTVVSTDLTNIRIYDDIYYGYKRIYCVPKYPPTLTDIDISKLDNSLFYGYSNHYPTPYVAMIAISNRMYYVEVHVKEELNFGDEPAIDSEVSISFDELSHICKFRNTLTSMLNNSITDEVTL